MNALEVKEWVVKDFETFFDDYTVIENHIDDNASLGGAMFETFGEELEFVKAQDPKHVWTYLDGGDTIIISSGFHYVNRLGYIVTKEPVANEYVEYQETLEDSE